MKVVTDGNILEQMQPFLKWSLRESREITERDCSIGCGTGAGS